jgi:hypothetical protein
MIVDLKLLDISKSLGLSKAIIRCFQLLIDRIRKTQLYKIAIRMICQG